MADTGSVKKRFDKSQWGWALFEWARTPFITIAIIYIAAPYYTSTVVGDPVRGQEIWGWVNGLSGLSVAVLAPILGAVADKTGARKPWIGAFVGVLLPASFFLYLAEPHASMGIIILIGALYLIANVAFEFTSVFYNAMLPSVVEDERIGRLSGLGLALGNVSSLIILIATLVFMSLPGAVDWSFIPAQPIFGLDQAAHEPERLSGPIVAAWLLVFALPLFLFTRDEPRRKGDKIGRAIVTGVGQVVTTIRSLKDYKQVAIFLGARMLYNDGKTATLTFGGVYAVGIFGWGVLDMTIYGIILSVFAVFGGFVGGWLDDGLGSKRALLIEILGTMAGVLLAVSITTEEIFFVIPVDSSQKLHGLPFFQTLPEMLYLAVVILIAIFITAAYASSRTMLARIAPYEKMTEFFGLYALSGTATAWMAPIAIATATALTESQRAGFSSILLFLGAGWLGLLFLHPKQERGTVKAD